MDEYSREPCPWRILDDAGGAFLMGAIGGGIFHSIKGFRNAPVGFSRKMVHYTINKINICVINRNYDKRTSLHIYFFMLSALKI